MAIYSSDLLFKDVNKEAEEILGYSKKQILNKSILEVNASGEFNIDEEKLASLLKGDRKSYTIQRKASGRRDKYSAFTATMISDGANVHLLGVYHRNDEELLDFSFIAGEFYNIERILSLNPDIHYIMDIDSKKYVYQNINILNSFGYTKEDIGDLNEIEFLISKIDKSSIRDVALANQKFKTEKSLGEFVEVEYRFLSKNEGWKWLKGKTTPLKQDKKANKVNLSYGILQDITEKKEIEEKLKSQKAFIDEVTNLVPDIIQVFDLKSYENIYANFQGKTFLGYSEQDWEDNSKGVKADFFSTIQKIAKKFKSLKDEEVYTQEMKYKNKDGKENWISLKFKVFKRDPKGNPVQILSVITDIHDYKSALINLELSQKTTKTIVNAIPDLLLILSKDGFYNKVMPGVDFTLDNHEEIVGRHISDLLNPTITAEISLLIKNCIETGETQYIEIERDYEDGSPHKFFSNYLSKLNDEEVLVIVRDETQKKKAQINLDDKVQLLSTQNEQLERFIEKNSELERFAYIISHDLKEPLRSINAISELIDIEVKKTGNEKLENLLGHLAQNSSRMIDLIEGVLDYSKIDYAMQAEEVNLQDLVKSVLKDLDKAIQDKFIQINCTALPTVMGDEIQLRQLFLNIIGNAVKFNDSISPVIDISFEEKETSLVFFVKDNGIGVPEHFKNAVFQMGKRVHSYMNYPGQGLGLTIAKKIVERHGGKLWIEDNKPNGAAFYFTLGKQPIF